MNKLIWIVSVVIALAVAVLYLMPKPAIALGFDIHILPFINALLNASVAVLLLIGFTLIRNKKTAAHKKVMLSAFGLSSLFLVFYVTYHALAPETRFGDTNHNGVLEEAEKAAAGGIRYFYYWLLITHIILAAGILPFILITLNHGLKQKFVQHRKIAKITFPLWLYVAVTGVVLYFMIAPYY